jgi:hypothetical protein
VSADTTETKESIQELVNLFPELFFAVNYLLEGAAGPLRKRSATILWILSQSERVDADGQYLHNGEIVENFRRWFAASPKTASKRVTEAKTPLYQQGLIEVKRGPKSIHLTDKGRDFVNEMRLRAFAKIRRATSALNPQELDQLVFMLRKVASTVQETARLQPTTPTVQTRRARKRKAKVK